MSTSRYERLARYLTEHLGHLIDWMVGERTTREIKGTVKHKEVTVRSDQDRTGKNITITINKTLYRTHHKAFWMPDITHAVYEVIATTDLETRARLPEQLFIPKHYPLLCNPLLRRTTLPHMYALHAFLNEFKESYISYDIEV